MTPKKGKGKLPLFRGNVERVIPIYDPHGVEGWHLGPATEHSIFYMVYINKKRSELTADTVEFTPDHTKIPGVSTK